MNYFKNVSLITLFLILLPLPCKSMKRLRDEETTLISTLTFQNIVFKKKGESLVAYKKPVEKLHCDHIELVENMYLSQDNQKQALILYLKENNLFLEEISCSPDSLEKLMIMLYLKYLPKDLIAYIAQLLLGNIVNSHLQCSGQLTGHTGRIWSITCSPHGLHFLTGSEDNTARLWDAGTGECLHTLQGDADFWGNRPYMRSAVFSSDGNTVLATGSHYYCVWDVSGKLLATIKDHASSENIALFSPDSKFFLTTAEEVKDSEDDKNTVVHLWDLSENLLATVGKYKYSVSALACSHDGKTIVVATHNGKIFLWDSTTFKFLTKFKIPNESKESCNTRAGTIVFSRDNTTFATGSYDRGIFLWDVKTGQLLEMLQKPSKSEFKEDGILTSVTFSSNGKTIAANSKYNTAHIWNISGIKLATLKGHSEEINFVLFSPDGKFILTGSCDNTARIWSLSGNQLMILAKPTSPLLSGSFSHDGQKVLIGSRNGTVHIWNKESNEALEWISTEITPLQAWLIIQASETKKDVCIISPTTLEEKIFLSMPEYVQEYLKKWYRALRIR